MARTIQVELTETQFGWLLANAHRLFDREPMNTVIEQNVRNKFMQGIKKEIRW